MLSGESPDASLGSQSLFSNARLSAERETVASDGREAGQVVGDYRLIVPLGQGGMGAVWEAEQVSLKRRVALKLLAPHLSIADEALGRFHREANAAARLSHPGIVAVIEAGEAEGVHYIAQELVPGGVTLADFLADAREGDQVPSGYYRAIGELFASLAEALQVAHDAGVIHRDIKPSNVLISENDQPKVADFGLAKINDDLLLSRTGELAGTPYYMSPEQASGQLTTVDHRTDVFSLGATLYECLTLRRPFEGDTSQQVLEQVISAEPPDPQKLRSRVPWELSVICSKSLEKRPEARFSSMGKLAADLRRWLANEPITARPPGMISRVGKWTRRHPLVSTVGAVLVAALILVSALLGQLQSRNVRLARMLTVMESLFGSPDPRLGRPERITATGMLLGNAEIVRTEFAAEPLVRARLLGAVGNVIRALDEHEQAEAVLAEVLATYAAEIGDRAVETLSARHALASLYFEGGRIDEAAKLYADAFEGRRAALGPGHVETLASQNALGATLLVLDRVQEAAPLVEAVLERRREILGEDDPETLCSLHNLGWLRWKQGKLDEAQSTFEQSVAHSRRVLGSEHPNTLWDIGDLASFHLSRGDLKAAENLLDEVIETRARIGDTKDLGMFASMAKMADIRVRQGRLGEAEILLRAASSGALGTQGEDHVTVLEMRSLLAHVLIKQEHHEEAGRILADVLERQRNTLGRAHDATLQTLHLKVWLLHSVQGDPLAAEPMAQELVDLTPPDDASLPARSELLRAIQREAGEG